MSTRKFGATLSMKRQPTVYVVDDDAALRRSTGVLLETASLACKAYESAEAFLADAEPAMPGCVILDLHMPGMNGMDLVTKMRRDQFILPMLVVTGTGSVPVAVQGMKLGLFDFLVKPVDPDVLLSKVQAAMRLDAEQRENVDSLRVIEQKLALLTPREQELLQLIVSGMPNKNIASELGISIKTVENHRASLMSKTGALNAADLVRMKMLATRS
jgi:RNA polymerase sigma factor (sigma-70 family)